ncbi:amidase family protein [Amycolatopsis sp. NPDC026612]|uniref:amidase family protein n=1 Tax=Amycolatopsis sp. NPDC026612 TaxID=3155466 RepID=UPI003401AFDE
MPALRRSLDDRQQTSVALVRRCLDRIAAVDPLVHAIIAVDEGALDTAAEADRRAAAGEAAGPLHGIPVLVKDNIDTAGLASTAGSRLLARTPPERDAAVVSRLRAAGAVVVGKTNLSEWANLRSVDGIEGWSAVGGQTRNAHLPGHSPWGSSAGSAVAVATGMAPLALGTETDGSIVCPAAVNGVVGVKPEPGLLPLDGIVPGSADQDSVGVLATRVGDAATCLDVLAGGGLLGEPVPLAGRRLGRWRPPGMDAAAERVADDLCARLSAAGAVMVPVDLPLDADLLEDGMTALIAELRPGLEAYLRSRRDVPATLPELIAAHRADPVELSLFGQDLFEAAAAVSPADRMVARVLRERSRRRARALIDGLLADHRLDAVLAPTGPPSWPLDHHSGDPRVRGSSTPAALAGYPAVSVPAGYAGARPVGVSVFGPAGTARTLALAGAVERAAAPRTGARPREERAPRPDTANRVNSARSFRD